MLRKNDSTDSSQINVQNVNEIIPDYDESNAKEARKAVNSLELDDLFVVLRHELRNKKRKTVLRRICQRISESSQALKDNLQSEAQKGFTILMVGQTGVGKSSTINSLFSNEVAETDEFDPTTQEVIPLGGTYNNVKYTIYDAPGLGEVDLDNQDLDNKYLSAMKKRCPSPDVLWVVFRIIDRVTEGEAKQLRLIRQHFGDTIWDRAMIVFTHSDAVSSLGDFHRIFEERTKRVNNVVSQITDGQKLSAVAVTNKHECTPDGESWLGELFTTSFERLNPERRNAFLMAFALELEIPKPSTPISRVQKPKSDASQANTETEERVEKTIPLTEDQVIRVEKLADPALIVSSVIQLAGIGASIDIATGGATLGVPTVVGAVLGGIVGLVTWSFNR